MNEPQPTALDLDRLRKDIEREKRRLKKNTTVSIVGDQITVNGITRTLTNPPRNRKERLEMIRKIKAAL